MNILVILAHPNKESFNHAIAAKAVERLLENEHNVFFHDLYAEQFDPILPTSEMPEDAKVTPQVEAHCRELSLVEGIVIIHPNWWGQPPAILKGWVDRILRPGIAYQPVEGEPIAHGLLKAKCAIVFNTSDTPEERENELFGDPLETIWKNCILGFCGVKSFYREMFRVVAISTPHQRHEWLVKVQESVNRHFPK
jgi:putative NADPH-quinone reductase